MSTETAAATPGPCTCPVLGGRQVRDTECPRHGRWGTESNTRTPGRHRDQDSRVEE